jgi:lipoprotein-anchoring transpeptidase ErfK/SrfK
MVLPSQAARSESRTKYSFRKKRANRLPLIVVGGGALLAAAYFGGRALFGSDSGSTGDASPPTNHDAAGVLLAKGSTATEVESPASPPASEDRAGASESTDEAGAGRASGSDEPRADGGSATDLPGGQSDVAIDWASIPPTAPPSAPESPAGTRVDDGLARQMEAAQRANQISRHAFNLMAQGDLLDARRAFTESLDTRALSDDMTEKVLLAVNSINDKLVFSPDAIPGDSFAAEYIIKSGETLEKIVKSRSLLVDWHLIKRINNIRDERRIQAGQEIKLITGPFHAVIEKSKYRLTLYMGDDSDRVAVRSFSVGLGEYNSTPTGMFKIGSRLQNPEWINPRTRQRYLPDDPSNPIGEHWLALIGIDAGTREFLGYGIHGTIEPDSIGRQQSMGCVRMKPEDVAIVYECLLTDVSTVEIRP